MVAELVQTARKRNDSYVGFSPVLKFVGMLSILLTFFVFNITLMPTRAIEQNLSAGSLLCHQVLPVLYVADWVVFYRRGQVRAIYPLIGALVPIAYVTFIFVRAAALDFVGDELYPYFFLDLGKLGVGGVAAWVAILTVAFMVVGYAIYGLDQLVTHRKPLKHGSRQYDTASSRAS